MAGVLQAPLELETETSDLAACSKGPPDVPRRADNGRGRGGNARRLYHDRAQVRNRTYLLVAVMQMEVKDVRTGETTVVGVSEVGVEINGVTYSPQVVNVLAYVHQHLVSVAAGTDEGGGASPEPATEPAPALGGTDGQR